MSWYWPRARRLPGRAPVYCLPPNNRSGGGGGSRSWASDLDLVFCYKKLALNADGRWRTRVRVREEGEGEVSHVSQKLALSGLIRRPATNCSTNGKRNSALEVSDGPFGHGPWAMWGWERELHQLYQLGSGGS
jgi:hypothetical protein